MVAQNAPKVAPPGMRELAGEAGLTYCILRAWSAGARSSSTEHVNLLAAELGGAAGGRGE